MLSVSNMDGDDASPDVDEVTEPNITSQPKRVIPEHLRTILAESGHDVPHKAQFLTHLTVEGLPYAVRTRHEGNSGILINGEVPVQIEYILRFDSGVICAVVRQYQPADVDFDPFSDFPLIGAKMWSTELFEQLEVVPIKYLKIQFAKCKVPWEGKDVTVIISLDKVSYTYSCF